jgi:hypothetical protein
MSIKLLCPLITSQNILQILLVCCSCCCCCCCCTWASAAGHRCTAACWLIGRPALDVPTLATRCPAPTDAFRTLVAEVGTYGLGIGPGILPKCRLQRYILGFFYIRSNLRHGTHGFTSLPKEGVLRIFPPLKIRRLRVPEASTLTPRPPKPLLLLYYRPNCGSKKRSY